MNLPETPYIDVSLYCGPYPYRRLPAATPDGLRALMDEAQIEAAIVTPFPALFYNQGWDGLRDWREAFRGDPRLHWWAVINPIYPGWEADMEAAAATPEVAGVRLYPRYHGYQPFDPALIQLLERASALRLPVNITARLLDDRLHPRMLRVDPPLDLQEVAALLKRFPSVTWVLSAFYTGELSTLTPALRAHPAAYVDIGCVKPPEFWWEAIVRQLPPERLLLGTGAPLYYHGGTRLSFARAELPEEIRAFILRENARRLLARS